jgi:hypothetical protein
VLVLRLCLSVIEALFHGLVGPRLETKPFWVRLLVALAIVPVPLGAVILLGAIALSGKAG